MAWFQAINERGTSIFFDLLFLKRKIHFFVMLWPVFWVLFLQCSVDRILLLTKFLMDPSPLGFCFGHIWTLWALKLRYSGFYVL